MAGASINDIKARIKSVEGTMQITKAMELVATSKLRHAKTRAENSKPYMKTLEEAMTTVSSFIPNGEGLYAKALNSDGKTLYIVIAGDRGLAGGYNNNIFKLVSSLDPEERGSYLPIGKKARDFIARRNREVFVDYMPSIADTGVGACMKIAEDICESFKRGEISSVKLIYTRFVTMLTQTPTLVDILPLSNRSEGTKAEPIFEEEIDELMEKIVPSYIGGIIHASVSEALASECAARRTAMNSANKNAEEMISNLVLSFNRARQAVITQEITEIVSGAEAL